MHRLKASVVIHVPEEICYREWSQFENFPKIFRYVKTVRQVEANHWRWTVTDPMGKDLHWEGIVDQMETNKVIRWHTPPEAEIASSGSVNFTSPTPDTTRLDVDMAYSAPFAPFGELLADLTRYPENMLEEELGHFKDYIEANFGALQATRVPHSNIKLEKERQLDREIKKP